MDGAPRIFPLIPILTDRTSEETDELCGMKYFWYKLFGGAGIVPVESPTTKTGGFFLEEGQAIHAAMEPFPTGATTQTVIDSIPKPSPDASQTEWEVYSRLVGWVAAWGEYYEPLLREHFEEVNCETEILLDRSPLLVAITPDRVQRRKGGGIVYREWKSTSTTQKGYAEHWQYAIQLHLGLQALKEELGETVEYGQVTGFYKGIERDGRLTHPYVWAYHRNGSWSHEYKAGWDHRPVWEYDGGTIEWIKRCGEETGHKQFIWSPPVMLDSRRVNEWVQVRLIRHLEIESVKDTAQTDQPTRLAHFKPASIHCRPAFGPACSYLAACHNYSVRNNPIGSGLYKEREPHHDLEKVYKSMSEILNRTREDGVADTTAQLLEDEGEYEVLEVIPGLVTLIKRYADSTPDPEQVKDEVVRLLEE